MRNKIKSFIFPTVVTVPFMLIYYYFALPAINLRSYGFWFWLLIGGLVFACCYFSWENPEYIKGIRALFGKQSRKKKSAPKKNITGNIFADEIAKMRADAAHDKQAEKVKRIAIIVLAIIGTAILVIACLSSRVFRAAEYQQMLEVTESDFSKDIAELPLSQIPVVDRDTAERLGSRKIGEVVELVSQFDVSSYYSQINYKDKPYRVSPLEYAGFLKWMANTSDGIPYYVTIDMATQETELVKLDEGMKYSPSEYFSRDLTRYIRMKYPTRMFENLSFEIDESGAPYWVMSYYDYTIGPWGGKDIAGVILVNAVSGETVDYPIAEVPQWIDLAYSSDLIIAQANNWGSLKNGFINSIFVQKNVVVTTDGYNYIAVDDDVWLYTGITSVSADQSNIGFILINMRTKEAKTYMINGAEEYSAMESAEGQIQEKDYVATFPILLNIADRPSYFVSLKDNAGLVKAYAFVSVSNYQIVGVSDTIDGAHNEYRRMLGLSATPDTDAGGVELVGIIDKVATAVVNGNSVYYLMVDGKAYSCSINVSDILPFLASGDKIRFVATEQGRITKIEIFVEQPEPELPNESE